MKKVLVLADYQACFLSHTILVGLHEQPGLEVFELPALQSVRGGVDADYELPDGTRGMTGTCGYLQPCPLPPYPHTAEELLDRLSRGEIDLAVMASGREHARRAWDSLHGLGLKLPPLVLCDGEDSSALATDLIARYRPAVYLKRELLAGVPLETYAQQAGAPTWPLQFGAFTRSLPAAAVVPVVQGNQGFTWNFFLSLGLTHPCRQRLLETCLQLDLPAAYIAGDGNNPLRERYPQMAQMLPWADYLTAMSQARVTAAVRGHGRDTLHALESFMSGAAVLYCPPGLWIPHPFIDRQHCVYFREDCTDFREKLVWLLEDEGYRKDIAAAGKRHCLTHHSTRARSEYLIQISERILGGEQIKLEEFGL